MLANFTGWHAVIVVAVLLLLFGATRLPHLSRSIGQSLRILRTEAAAVPDEATQPSAAGEQDAQSRN